LKGQTRDFKARIRICLDTSIFGPIVSSIPDIFFLYIHLIAIQG